MNEVVSSKNSSRDNSPIGSLSRNMSNAALSSAQSQASGSISSAQPQASGTILSAQPEAGPSVISTQSQTIIPTIGINAVLNNKSLIEKIMNKAKQRIFEDVGVLIKGEERLYSPILNWYFFKKNFDEHPKKNKVNFDCIICHPKVTTVSTCIGNFSKFFEN
jgi:hypothetical protein